MKQPSIRAILKKLREVLSGDTTREDIANWSLEIIGNDEIEIENFQAWEFLKIVGGIDLFDSPETYLYSEADIKNWIEQYSKFVYEDKIC